MRAIWLTCCVTLFACEVVAAPRLEKLRLYETPHYTLISDTPAHARNMHARLTKFERVLVRTLGREMEPTGTPTYFFLVNGAAWLRYLQPAEGIVGVFTPVRFSNYMLVNADAGAERLPHDVQHEFTHLFLRTQFRGEYPLWFDEGMAELMEHATLGNRVARFQIPARGPSAPWIPFSRLVNLERLTPEYLSPRMKDAVQLQSWALVHMGFIADPDFGLGILRYIESINSFVPIRDAVQDSFGMSVAEVDVRLRQYLAQDKFPVAELEYPPPPPSPLGDGLLLGDGEAYALFAHAMLDTGLQPRRVREVIDVAAAASPASPVVGVLEMRLAVRGRDDTALERHYESLTKLPATADDAAIARGMGLALFERLRDEAPANALSSERRAEMSHRALALLDRALTAKPSDGEATWAYALLAARLGENLEIALSRLAFTRRLVRDNSDLAMATALVHESRGDLGAMLPFLEEAAQLANSAEKRRVANARVAEIRRRLSDNAPL